MSAGKTHNTLRRGRGTAMLMVLIALALLTVLALSFLASQEPTALVASNIDRKAKARLIAESALNMAIDYVNEDPGWRTDKASGRWITAAGLDGGTFDLYGEDEADGDLADNDSEPVRLTVVATYNGVTHRVSAVVTPNKASGSSPANRLLLVVGSVNSPSAQDSAKKTLFESWGYTVTLIDDGAAQTQIDAAVAVNDVVYISEEVYSSSVDTDYRDAAIGVVNEEGRLNDDFGFTNSETTTTDTGSWLVLTDVTHPITDGFSLGNLTVFTSSQKIRELGSASAASGVQELAEETCCGGSATLMVADLGATLYFGSAPARRVMWPASDDYNINALNADGKTVLRRSIEWAAGEAAADVPQLLALYAFDEQPVADPVIVGHWMLDETPVSGAGGVSAGDKIELKDAARIDAYDSSLGLYTSQSPTNNAAVTINSTGGGDFKVERSAYIGGSGFIGAGGNPDSVYNVAGTLTGSRNVLSTNIPISRLTAPTGLPDSSGGFSRSGGTAVIDSDVTYSTFRLSGNAAVTIVGNVTMHVTGDLELRGNSQLIIPPGSSLTLYTGDDVHIEDNAQLNGDSSATDRLTLYAYGYKHVDLRDDAEMAGTVYTNDELHLKNDTRFYGIALAGDKIKLEDDAQLHQDLALGGFSGSGGEGAASSFGLTEVGNKTRDLNGDQVAMRFTLDQAMTIDRLSAYVNGGDDGAQMRLAIYADGGTAPGELLAESDTVSLAEERWAWQSASVGPLPLSAGVYWLALSLDGDDRDARYAYQPGGGDHNLHHQYNNAVENGFSNPWGTSSRSDSRQLCIYASGSVSAGSGGGDGGALTMPQAFDQSDTANHGAYQGGAVGGQAGFGDGGTSVYFDGDGDYLEIPHDSAYLLDAGTISLHAYPTSTAGTHAIASKDASGNGDGGQFTIYTDGTRLCVSIETTTDDPYNTGDTITLRSTAGVVNQDQWNHIAMTWGDGQVRLYHGGLLVASANHLGGLGTTSGGSGNTEPLVIGAGTGTSGDGVATPISDAFEGRIDDVRIYDTPMDAGQIGDLEAGSGPSPRTAPGYVIADTSGYASPADMLVYDTSAINWIAGGGLAFTGDTIATTLGDASKIKDAIETNGEFAVEFILTRMTPATTDAPSYLFGYSNDPAVHNFMFGQDGGSYEARVRDSDTGTSGVLSPDFVSASNLNSSGDTHIVLSYSACEVRVYVDGVLDETRTTSGTLDNWDDTLLLVLGGAYDDTHHWRGTIKRIAIYDEGFNANQARNVFNGEAPGDGSGTGAGTAVWDELD